MGGRIGGQYKKLCWWSSPKRFNRAVFHTGFQLVFSSSVHCCCQRQQTPKFACLTCLLLCLSMLLPLCLLYCLDEIAACCLPSTSLACRWTQLLTVDRCKNSYSALVCLRNIAYIVQLKMQYCSLRKISMSITLLETVDPGLIVPYHASVFLLDMLDPILCHRQPVTILLPS